MAGANGSVMNARTLRAGMIGAGSSATNIAATIATIPGVDLVAACDTNIDMARKLASDHGASLVTADRAELCKQDLDFIIVSTPHGTHAAIVQECLEAGKHVLVEKPIATTVPDARAMISAARDRGLVLGVHFQCRFFDAVQEAKRIIDSDGIGRVLQANVSVMWHREASYYTGSSWRGTWALEGGGSLINQAIHPVDEMVHLVGDVQRLFGFWGHLVHDIEVDDNTAAAFTFENGAFGTIQTSTATKAAFPARLTIFGADGGLEIDGNILTVHHADGTSTRTDYAAQQGGQVGSAKDPRLFSLVAHGRLMQDYCDAVREGRDPLVTGEEALRSLKVVRAVYESNGERLIDL